jgi:hypothetical protein
MLLTGFDAPIEQASTSTASSKPQPAANHRPRQPRPQRDKVNGFIVIMSAWATTLNEALETYDERERKEITDELNTLDQSLAGPQGGPPVVLDS